MSNRHIKRLGSNKTFKCFKGIHAFTKLKQNQKRIDALPEFKLNKKTHEAEVCIHCGKFNDNGK